MFDYLFAKDSALFYQTWNYFLLSNNFFTLLSEIKISERKIIGELKLNLQK